MKHIRFKFWQIGNWLAKRWIVYSDKLGLFSYRRWLRRNQPRTAMENLPEITVGVLIDARKGDEKALARTLKSLEAQIPHIIPHILIPQEGPRPESSYTCIPADGPLHRILEEIAGDLQLDFLALTRAGDRFETGWLAACAAGIAQEKYPHVIYTDQDWVDPHTGAPANPFLKPDFSPAMQCSVNLLEMALFRRDWVAAQSLNAATFPDLVAELGLRAAEGKIQAAHIPGIFCHSTRPPFPGPKYNRRRLPLVQKHLARLGLPKADAEITPTGEVRLHWIPERKLVSIIIPNKDRPVMLRRTLETLSDKTCYPVYEVILVDNASTDPETLALYRQFTAESWCRLVEGPARFNYSAFNNLGGRQSRGEYLLFLNNDVEIMSPSWLDELVMWVSRPSVGVVGAQLLYPDGRLQHAGVVLGLVGSAGHVFIGEDPAVSTPFGSPNWYRDCLAVTGACLMTRREVFEALGGFDEGYRLTFSDITYCLAAVDAGYRVIYNPAARLVHHEGGTRGRHIPITDLQRMYWELRPRVAAGDPFYNPLLSHLVGTPSLRRAFEEPAAARMDRIQEHLGSRREL